MDIWDTDKLALFLMFVLPGFVSLRVWDLLVPGERRGLDNSLIEVVSYSALNFAALSWLITPLLNGSLGSLASYVSVALILVVFPATWPFLWKWLRTREWITRFTVHPVSRPWDYVFSKREPAWIIVHLKNGSVVGGRYDNQSFASSWPASEQIFLEELWVLNAKRAFVSPVERSRGAIVLSSEILAIEFFSYLPEDATNHG